MYGMFWLKLIFFLFQLGQWHMLSFTMVQMGSQEDQGTLLD